MEHYTICRCRKKMFRAGDFTEKYQIGTECNLAWLHKVPGPGKLTLHAAGYANHTYGHVCMCQAVKFPGFAVKLLNWGKKQKTYFCSITLWPYQHLECLLGSGFFLMTIFKGFSWITMIMNLCFSKSPFYDISVTDIFASVPSPSLSLPALLKT